MTTLFVIKVLPRELHRCSWKRVIFSRCCLQYSRRSRCTLSARSDMSSKRVRTLFLEYFVNQHSHQFVPSSPVLPHGDPSLLFTNAGMNQFKAIFLGLDNIPSSLLNLKRAANSQKCVRVGGKHNDLDDVGKDGYHHTFFEMLGNWSFGDYFKKEACEMSWKLLTDVYGIQPQKLFVTYFGGSHELGLCADEECREVWLQIGVPHDHIIPFGLKDNFWDMGETGPCGPCTEIHYSHLDNNDIASRLVNQGSPYVIEIWNIVFMQYNRLPDGKLVLLPKSHVDTGMGLERLTAVLQNSISNYDTDLFRPLFNVIQKETGCRPYSGLYGGDDHDGVDTAYRIIADHARMCAVSISDGLLPDEIGAGHCLRKIIRHSLQVSVKNLRSSGGLVDRLIPQVAASLESAYPEISSNTTKVIEVIQQEEEMFLRLMDKGLKLFKRMTNKLMDNIFPAQYMWELYFVNGIPEDIILDLIASKGFIPETEDFHKRKIQQKEFQKNIEMQKKFGKSLAFTNTHAQLLIDRKIPLTEDSSKYDAQYSSCGEFLGVRGITSNVVALWDGSVFVNHTFPEVELSIITKETNFYSESGGQIGDVGVITSLDGARFEVRNTICVMGYVLHQGVLTTGSLQTGDRVHMSIDKDHREGCMMNHTATHLLNAALHKLLERTEQRSSYVTSDYLRFDFLAKEALTKAQILSVEEFVRDAIINKYSVKKLVKPFVDIIKVPNLRVLPGETYADEVKVIAIVPNVNEELPTAVSLELCCGTHVDSTSSILDFVIFSQKPQAQSIRSIHAITGLHALNARKVVNELEQDIYNLSTQVKEAESQLSQGSCVTVAHFSQILSNKRATVQSLKLPLVPRDDLDKHIEALQRRVTKITRINVKNEIQELLVDGADSNFIVHLLKYDGDAKTVLREVIKMMPKKPFMICVCFKNSIHGRTYVPLEMCSENINAEKWSLEILKRFNGQGNSLKPNQSSDFLFNIVGSDMANEVMEVARLFAKNHFM